MMIPIKQIITENEFLESPVLNKFDAEGASKFVDNAYRDAKIHTDNLPYAERKSVYDALKTGNDNLANDRMDGRYLPTRTFEKIPGSEENPFNVAQRQAQLEAGKNRLDFNQRTLDYNIEQAKLNNKPIPMEPTVIQKVNAGIQQYGIPVLAGAGLTAGGALLHDRLKNRNQR